MHFFTREIVMEQRFTFCKEITEHLEDGIKQVI